MSGQAFDCDLSGWAPREGCGILDTRLDTGPSIALMPVVCADEHSHPCHQPEHQSSGPGPYVLRIIIHSISAEIPSVTGLQSTRCGVVARQPSIFTSRDVNWPEAHKALGAVGYNGYITAEIEGGDAAYLKDVVARLERISSGQSPVAK